MKASHRGCTCPIHWSQRIGVKQLAGTFASPQTMGRFAKVVADLEEQLAAGADPSGPLMALGNSAAPLAMALALERLSRTQQHASAGEGAA